MATTQGRWGSYAQKPTTDTPGRRRIFGKTGALHELDPRQETTLSREWRCAKNTLSGFSLRQGEHPNAMGAAGIARREAAVEAVVAKAKAAISRLEGTLPRRDGSPTRTPPPSRERTPRSGSFKEFLVEVLFGFNWFGKVCWF